MYPILPWFDGYLADVVGQLGEKKVEYTKIPNQVNATQVHEQVGHPACMTVLTFHFRISFSFASSRVLHQRLYILFFNLDILYVRVLGGDSI